MERRGWEVEARAFPDPWFSHHPATNACSAQGAKFLKSRNVPPEMQHTHTHTHTHTGGDSWAPCQSVGEPDQGNCPAGPHSSREPEGRGGSTCLAGCFPGDLDTVTTTLWSGPGKPATGGQILITLPWALLSL